MKHTYTRQCSHSWKGGVVETPPVQAVVDVHRQVSCSRRYVRTRRHSQIQIDLIEVLGRFGVEFIQ